MSAVNSVIYENDFKRNKKKMLKRGRDTSKLDKTIEYLRTYQKDKLKDNHPLTKGKYKGNWDCHIEGDWVLIYRYEDNNLILVLVTTGDHQMIFGESYMDYKISMSDLDIEVKEAKGKNAWLRKNRKETEEEERELDYLQNEAPREIGRGGNFESMSEIADTIKETKDYINYLKNKRAVVLYGNKEER